MNPAEGLRGLALGHRMQRMGLESTDAFADQGGHVPVTAVFAEQVRGVPEPGDGFPPNRERSQSGVGDSPIERRTRTKLGVPVLPVSERQHFCGRLRGGVRNHRDRLRELVEAAGHVS